MGAHRQSSLKRCPQARWAGITRDGVPVFVRLLLDDLDQVLHDVPPPLVDNHGCGQVPQQVLRVGLDGVHVPTNLQRLIPLI